MTRWGEGKGVLNEAKMSRGCRSKENKGRQHEKVKRMARRWSTSGCGIRLVGGGVQGRVKNWGFAVELESQGVSSDSDKI